MLALRGHGLTEEEALQIRRGLTWVSLWGAQGQKRQRRRQLLRKARMTLGPRELRKLTRSFVWLEFMARYRVAFDFQSKKLIAAGQE